MPVIPRKSGAVSDKFAQAALAANQNRLSTKIVLNTAPLNAHQCSCLERNGKVPTIKRTPTSTTAHTIPQGV